MRCVRHKARTDVGVDNVLLGGKEHNSQFFLLDAYRQLVPTGVLGELYIAGDGTQRTLPSVVVVVVVVVFFFCC